MNFTIVSNDRLQYLRALVKPSFLIYLMQINSILLNTTYYTDTLGYIKFLFHEIGGKIIYSYTYPQYP